MHQATNSFSTIKALSLMKLDVKSLSYGKSCVYLVAHLTSEQTEGQHMYSCKVQRIWFKVCSKFAAWQLTHVRWTIFSACFLLTSRSLAFSLTRPPTELWPPLICTGTHTQHAAKFSLSDCHCSTMYIWRSIINCLCCCSCFYSLFRVFFVFFF